MDRKELEDCMHGLCQVYGFYSKEFDDVQRAFWMQAIQGVDPQAFLIAVRQYTREGRYAPKPKDVLDIMERDKPRTADALTIPAELGNVAPKHISDAWRYWLPKFWGKETGGVMGQPEGSVSHEKAEEMLILINKEAKRVNNPDAIPFDYKLVEVWQ